MVSYSSTDDNSLFGGRPLAEDSRIEPSQPSRTDRRRRRLRIAGLFLALVSIAGCWHWPRADQRFVGKWEFAHEHTPTNRLVFTLQGNGLGSILGASSSFPWLVRGNQLIFGEKSRPQIWWMAHDAWSSITGQDPYFKGFFSYTKGEEHVYEILSVAGEEIRLKSKEKKIVHLPNDSAGNRSVLLTDDPVIVILTRAPE